MSEYKLVSTKDMVNLFLGWKLPNDFSPDGGINFIKSATEVYSPTGTNLLNAEQAKVMFEFCSSNNADFNIEFTCKRIRRLLNAMDISDPSNGKDHVLMGCLFSLLGSICGKIEKEKQSDDRAEYEAMKADAERYRWLRHGKTQSARVVFGKYPDEINIHDNKNHLINKELDHAIDQARFNNEG